MTTEAGENSFAASPRSLLDAPIHELSHDDRREHAGLLVSIDGEKHDCEQTLLREVSTQLRISSDDAAVLLDQAERQAKSLREGL